MSMTVNGVELSKGVEILNGAIKLANNLSEKQKNPPRPEKKVVESTNTSTNQPHTQTVEVKVGDLGQQPGQPNRNKFWDKDAKPVIVKPYPDGRELSERECEVEKQRLNQEHERKMKELEFWIRHDENERNDRKEREDYERKERERRREENRKANRRFAIGAGIVGAGCLGLIGWGMYTASRNCGGSGRALPEPKAELNVTVNGEGTVQ